MTQIIYSMLNEINGRPYRIAGGGRASAGITTLSAEISDLPVGWSGVLLPCICSGPGQEEEEFKDGKEKCLIAFAPNGYATEPGTLRRATLWDKSGNVIARVSATGRYSVESDGLHYDIKVQTKTEPGTFIQELANVDHYSFIILPRGPGRATVISHYSLSTLQGDVAQGATYIDYRFIGSEREVPEVIAGINKIKVQQMGTRIQWMVRQTTALTSELGLLHSSIQPLQ